MNFNRLYPTLARFNPSPLLLVALLAFSAAGLHGPASAAPQAQRYLPAEAVVKEALLASPGIQSARAQKEALSLRAKTLRTGTAEFTLRANLQERRVPASHERLHEQTLSLERPVRLWGKSAVDGQLSDKTVALADITFNDAMHEASRELMKLWFVHAQAALGLSQAQRLVQSATQIHQLAQARFKQGEIARLDLELSQAEVQRAQAAQQLAQAELANATSALSNRYPGLPLPTQALEISTPEIGDFADSQADLKQAFFAQNHELHMLRLEAERLQLLAQRAQLDRLPDPTVGVYSARDRSGAEQVTGLSLSMPLSGAVRRDHALATLADAQAAADKVRRLQQQLGAEFDQRWTAFHSQRAAATELQMAADTQTRAADKSRKAYALGEHSLFEMLMIARAAHEQQFAASRLQLEMLESLALLQLELHQIWDFDL
jgi:outer membrane protein TolC